MKKLFFLLLAVMPMVVLSQSWTEFAPAESQEPIINVTKSCDTIVEFKVFVPGMFSTAVDSFNRVQIKEHIRMDSTGNPELPVINYLVAIPDCDSVIVNIEILDSIQFSNFNIYPAPELVEDTEVEGYVYLKEEFVYNDTAYTTDSNFPGLISETIDRGAVRAQQCMRVLFYPVQFNPVTKELVTYSELKISLSFVNPISSIQQDVGIFNEMLVNSLVNYESNGLNSSVSCGMEATTLDCEDYFVTSLPKQKIYV